MNTLPNFFISLISILVINIVLFAISKQELIEMRIRGEKETPLYKLTKYVNIIFFVSSILSIILFISSIISNCVE